MKILFITAGILSDRSQTLCCQESLMDEMANRGHEVSCVCTADMSWRPWVYAKTNIGRIRIHRIFNWVFTPGFLKTIAGRSSLLWTKA